MLAAEPMTLHRWGPRLREAAQLTLGHREPPEPCAVTGARQKNLLCCFSYETQVLHDL